MPVGAVRVSNVNLPLTTSAANGTNAANHTNASSPTLGSSLIYQHSTSESLLEAETKGLLNKQGVI